MLTIPVRFVPLVLAMLCVAVATPSWAENQVEFFHTGERRAFASFTVPVAGDVTGCLVNSFDVRVFDDHRFMRKEGPGKPIIGSFPSAGMSILEINTCESQITKYDECSSTDATGFNVSPSLDWATLDTSMTCIAEYDYELPPFEIAVNITWEATGPVVRLFRHDRQTGNGAKTFTLIRVARREAVATGSVLLNGANVILDESNDAQIVAERRMTHSSLAGGN